MRIKEVSAKKLATEIYSHFNKKKSFIFFIGAYVSKKGPTNIPFANELKQTIFNISLNTNHEIRDNIDNIVNIKSDFFKKRFEKVPLEQIMYDLIKIGHFEPKQILNFICQSIPNSNHYVLSHLLENKYTKIITTNYDELIEQCMGYKKNKNLYKPHGTISDNKKIVVKISDVGKQLINNNVKRKLRSLLNNSIVLFIGYSGRDVDIRNLSIEMRQILLLIMLHYVKINQPEPLVYLSIPDYLVS